MHSLHKVELTWEQLEWLLDVNFTSYVGWTRDKLDPNILYAVNKDLRIQVTRYVGKEEGSYTIWTWEE